MLKKILIMIMLTITPLSSTSTINCDKFITNRKIVLELRSYKGWIRLLDNNLKLALYIDIKDKKKFKKCIDEHFKIDNVSGGL